MRRAGVARARALDARARRTTRLSARIPIEIEPIASRLTRALDALDAQVVLLGEGRVGKTSLLLRYVENTFSETQTPTVQATYLSKRVALENGGAATLNVWDTAGQERFHALGPIYYRDADAAVLVYDITDSDSFDRVKSWVKELRQIAGSEISLAVCANKSDLERARKVSQSDGETYAKSIGAAFFSTSAKADKGVAQAFMSVATALDAKRGKSAAGGGGAGTKTSGVGRSRSLKIAEEEMKPRGGDCC